MLKGIIAHEIGHLLGLIHEHQRSDRDLHVTVQWQNLKNGSESAYYKMSSISYNQLYDYTSVMHYKNTVICF